MKIGDIDLINSILTLEADVKVLQLTLIHILENNPNVTRPTTEDIQRFRSSAIEILRTKYPNMDIGQR